MLFTVADPAAAVTIAITLTARGEDPDDPFPAVRAGIAHGVVVRRLGDVFGSTVNAASRLTSAARPGTVLVDAGVHEALTEAADDGDDDGDDGLTLALAPAAPGVGQGLQAPRGLAGQAGTPEGVMRIARMQSPRVGTGGQVRGHS